MLRSKYILFFSKPNVRLSVKIISLYNIESDRPFPSPIPDGQRCTRSQSAPSQYLQRYIQPAPFHQILNRLIPLGHIGIREVADHDHLFRCFIVMHDEIVGPEKQHDLRSAIFRSGPCIRCDLLLLPVDLQATRE